VYKSSLAVISADVGRPAFISGEKNQVAGLQLSSFYFFSVRKLVVGLAGYCDSVLLVGPPGQAGTVKTIRGFAPQAVSDAYLFFGGPKDTFSDIRAG
jgi:hypothetical protein